MPLRAKTTATAPASTPPAIHAGAGGRDHWRRECRPPPPPPDQNSAAACAAFETEPPEPEPAEAKPPEPDSAEAKPAGPEPAAPAPASPATVTATGSGNGPLTGCDDGPLTGSGDGPVTGRDCCPGTTSCDSVTSWANGTAAC